MLIGWELDVLTGSAISLGFGGYLGEPNAGTAVWQIVWYRLAFVPVSMPVCLLAPHPPKSCLSP